MATRKPAPEPSQPRGLTPEQLRAREFALRVLHDPGYADFLEVLELDLFQQWRALNGDDADQVRELREGLRVFTAKLQELANIPKG